MTEVVVKKLPLVAAAAIAAGVAGAVLNGAKEVALDAFIEGRTGFLQMAEIVEKVMDRLSPDVAAATLDDVFSADHWARGMARSLIAA